MYKLTLGLLVYFLLFGAGNSHAQTIAQIDSIFNRQNLGNNLHADSLLFDQVYKKSKTIGYKSGMARALARLATILINQNKYSEALKVADEAQFLGTEINDNSILARTWINKSRCFTELGFVDQGRQALVAAKTYAMKIEDSELRHFNLGGVYRTYANNLELGGNASKLSDSILFYLKLAYAEHKKVKKPISGSGLVVSASHLGRFYIERKEYDSARHYLNQALSTIGDRKLSVMGLGTYFELGFLDYTAKKYESALINYNQALKIANSTNSNLYKRDIYLALSNIYEEIGNKTKAKEFLKKYIELSQLIQNEKVNSLAVPMGFIIKENEKIHGQREQDYIKTIVFIVAFCLLILIVGVFLFRRSHKEKISAKEQASLLQEKVQQLEAQIPEKNLDTDELKTVVQLAMTNDPSFFVKFNELDKEFVEKLLQIAPNLVASELELCAQLRLCFETKEIARYTGLSVRAIQGKKHRIRKKLNIPVHEDLNVWMSQL